VTDRTKKRGGARPTTIGGILAGLDQEIFRNTPPPHDLVLRGPIVKRTAASGDGFTVDWPEDRDVDPEPEASQPRVS
jgi:hypothetical protein